MAWECEYCDENNFEININEVNNYYLYIKENNKICKIYQHLWDDDDRFNLFKSGKIEDVEKLLTYEILRGNKN